MMVGRRAFLAGVAGTLCGCAAPTSDNPLASGPDIDPNTLHHVSTIDALGCGHFSDETTIGDLLARGGFGLGTVNGVDGELVVVDDVAYAVRGDGRAVELDPETRTPFAAVTTFEPDRTIELHGIESFEDFRGAVTETLPRPDHVYALDVAGTFEFLRTRSVTGQVEPYPTLEAVLDNETVFEFHDVAARLPTFVVPEQLERIHPPGFHAHAITADRSGGGHVYEFAANSLTVRIDHLDSITLDLPSREVADYPPC